MKKPKVFNIKSFVINTLRRASYRFPNRGTCVKNARRARGLYECAQCKTLVKNKNYVVDHIHPVIPIDTGFTSWDSFIENLFCDVSNFQLLCKSCHEAKTMVERELRQYYKKLKKDI